MKPVPIYFGHDERVQAGTTVFVSSVIERASVPVALTPVCRRALPSMIEGSNAFTFRRFLVPWMQGFTGWAIFADGSDMVCLGDIADLWEMRRDDVAVQVVKVDYRTRHPRKYVSTAMESENADYPRKNWVSLMLINCAHPQWREVTPEYVARAPALDLLQLRFLKDEQIGTLPASWNWLVDEFGHHEEARLLHFTAGIPAFPAYANAPMAARWYAAAARAMSATGVL
jgi:hypothetical protein